MKFNKIQPGTPAGQMPSFSASWQNAVSESAQAYQEQKRLSEGGNGGKGLRDTENRVKCYNNTATPFLRGQSIQLDGYRMTTVKHRQRWFNGTDYDSSEMWGVVLRDMDDTGTAEVQMLGVCTARVNVTDLNHTHANPTASSRNFESGSSGDLEFLSTPSSTGVQDVVVRFTPGQVLQDELRAEFSSYHDPGTSGNTYGIIEATSPVNLPTGTPAVTEDPLYIADIHEIGSGLSSGDIVRAIRNVGVDTYSSDSVNWEGNLDGAGGGSGGSPEIGCGLEYESDVLQVDLDAIAGNGIKVGSDGTNCDAASSHLSPTTYCCLYIDVGCGLMFNSIDSDKIEVDIAALAGKGLITDQSTDLCVSESSDESSTYCCLAVNIGCGLQYSGDSPPKIEVDLDALAGAGLGKSISSSDCDSASSHLGGTYCCLKVNVGCGLDIVSDNVVVDRTDLMGSGLVAGSGTCDMDVNVDSTYLEINGSNEISLSCNPLKAITCALEKDSNGDLKLTINYTLCDDSTGSTSCTLSGTTTCGS